jgi:hypothetical protein
MLVHRGREDEDFTRDRSDFKDATIIAKKITELRCYVPYQLEGHWCRLRHLGSRRDDQLTVAGAARQQLRDLLECAWPAVLRAAADPLDSLTWRAALAVSTDPGEITAMGLDALAAAGSAELPRWSGHRRNLRIVRAIWTAAQDPGGVLAERAAAAERARFALGDWHRALAEIAEIEQRMLAVLDTLELTELVTSITGLSAVGAAAILAQTGDPAQARRAVPARQRIRRLPRRHHHLPPRPARAAHRGLARDLGRAAAQPRLPGPLRPPHRPHRQPAAPRPGSRRDRRRTAAPTARRRHPPRRLEPGPRRRRAQRGGGATGRMRRH